MPVHDLRWVKQPDDKLILEAKMSEVGKWLRVPVDVPAEGDYHAPVQQEQVITISETTFRRLMQDYIAHRIHCRDGDAMLWKSPTGAPSIRLALEQVSHTQESMGYSLDWPKSP